MSVAFTPKAFYSTGDLISIVAILRSEQGCPWDREQTHESIRMNFLEETYEALEAIDSGSAEGLCEELGDVLLQVAMHAQMEAEAGVFNFDDVVNGIAQKLVYRHPHIFAGGTAETTEQVLTVWDELKRREKNQTSHADTLSSVPAVYPALMRAQKVHKRARKSGLVSYSTEKSVAALQAAAQRVGDDPGALAELLLLACAVADGQGTDAEQLLQRETQRFISAFSDMEAAGGQAVGPDSTALISLWKEAQDKV